MMPYEEPFSDNSYALERRPVWPVDERWPLVYPPSAVPDLARMPFILIAVLVIIALLVTIRPKGNPEAVVFAAAAEPAADEWTAEADLAAEAGGGVMAPAGVISPVFTPEVQYWAANIVAWAAAANVDPNMAAIIMQIESCGDPKAISSAGAQGLFQVMPFHFTAGEDSLDPDTNARRGLNYFAERMAQTAGDVGRAFAGYNGGHVAAAGGWDSWVNETRRYYTWSTGIHNDIQAGLNSSPTLDSWLAAGGASLCRQAANRLGLPG
jgi:soluble lytic murein transglycosylase-like protein